MRQPAPCAARTTLALALPPLPLAKLRGQTGDSWQIVHVERGQTLGALFEELDVPAATMHQLLDQPGAKQALTRMKPGTELAFDLPVDGQLRALPLRPRRHPPRRTGASTATRSSRRSSSARPRSRTVVISGTVGKSLFHSARKLGPVAAATSTR